MPARSSPRGLWVGRWSRTKQGKRQVVGIDADQKGTVEMATYPNNFKRYEYRAEGS
jgi:hypothetical protein